MIDLIENKIENFKSLTEFKEFIKLEDKTKKDRLIQFKDWEMKENGIKIGNKTFPMRQSGMKTLLRTFQMPEKFYSDKAPTDMLVRDINRMKSEYTDDSEFFVHLQGNEVRAFSRPNATHASNINVINECVTNKSLFKRASYSDYGIRLVTADSSKPLKVEKGDIMNIGNDIVFSDINYYPLSGSPHLLRLVCTNGMVMQEKNPLLSTFKMSMKIGTPEEAYISQLANNLLTIDINGERLVETFRMMKDNPIKALGTNGEKQMARIRSSIGADEFDSNERLSRKVMIDDKEKSEINLELPLYTAVDIITRKAKEYNYIPRRKIESLAGGLTMLAFNQLN